MNTPMATFLSALLVMAASGCASTRHKAPETTESYALVATYPVGGAGGWDFLSVDGPGHRLYVSRGDHVQILDTLSGKVVGDLPGTAGVHGVAVAGDLGLGFTSNGRSDSVTVFDLATLAVLETVKVTGTNPDAILYEPRSKRVLTFNGRSANVTAIDARTRKVVGTVAVSGKPEVAVADGRGRVFVNIEDRNSIAVIDMVSLAVSNEWPLGSCDGPTGLAIDRQRDRLFSVCHNRKMIVVDATAEKRGPGAPDRSRGRRRGIRSTARARLQLERGRHADRREGRRCGSILGGPDRRYAESRAHDRAGSGDASHLSARRYLLVQDARRDRSRTVL